MRLNLKSKLFILCLGFILFFIVSNIVFNLFWMSDYYIYKYKGILKETSETILKKYQRKPENIEQFILKIDRNDGISVTITEYNYEIKYVSYPNKKGVEEQEFPIQIESIIDEHKDMEQEEICEVAERRRVQVPKYIYYVTRTNQNGLLVLVKSMKGIGESVEIANELYLYIGAVMVLLGLVVTTLFAKRISAPIILMSKAAKNISNLDFSDRIQIKNKDEIGLLGDSINEISVKLSDSINNMLKDIERRKQLTRDISHELKTPIGVIKGYAEGLQYGIVESKEKKEKYCRVIAEECDRMDLMVKNLLELSILEDAIEEPKLISFEIKPLLLLIQGRFEGLIKEKRLNLEITCNDDLILNADYNLLDRAIGNFISNAIKYTTEEGCIQIQAAKLNHDIVISVFNTGTPIPEEELGKVWDVFYKVDRSRSRSKGGHGIGLSIAKRIARLHGGDVYVKNKENGVIFWMNLPIV